MPTVDGKRYAYTPEGRARAAAARRKKMKLDRAGAARTQARTTAAREQAQESRSDRAGMARAKRRQMMARKYFGNSPAGKVRVGYRKPDGSIGFGTKRFAKKKRRGKRSLFGGKKRSHLRGFLAKARAKGYKGRFGAIRRRLTKG